MFIITYKGHAMPPLPSLGAVSDKLAEFGVETIKQAEAQGFAIIQVTRSNAAQVVAQA